ncbi:hypothetical protein ACFX15_017949 [Malus domestica]
MWPGILPKVNTTTQLDIVPVLLRKGKSMAASSSTPVFGDVYVDELISSCRNSFDLSKPTDRPKALKLLSGSCYLPHPDKEATGGEDAHFICEDAQAIGVADGVGGWADVGVNAGFFSRELMSHSVRAIQEEPEGCFNPARVLEKACSCTKAKGSSTACIIGLTEKQNFKYKSQHKTLFYEQNMQQTKTQETEQPS